jgi:alpha-glucosidase
MSLSKRLGEVREISAIQNGIQAVTSLGHFVVEAYSDHILRVCLSQELVSELFSYAVLPSDSTPRVEVDQGGDHIIVRTPFVEVTIDKRTSTFRYADRQGNLLNEEDTGLGTSWIGDQVTSYRKLQPGERFIGLGEKTGPLDRKGNGYENWNTDAYAYNNTTDPLYCSMPFYMGIHQGRQYGIYLDNTHKSFFNFGASNNRFSSFSADAGPMNYYFIAGNSIAEIIQHYTQLTGRIPLPPRWSIGYQQCRYSYYPDTEVLNTAQTFRDKAIPADAIVLDIHYMDQYKIFTWDSKHFPNPKGMLDQLKEQGFEIVVMCDPGIKAEAGYPAYEDGKAHDVFVKYPDGEYYTGQVWPGWCHFPDFTNPATRAWWMRQLKRYADLGIEGYWNDMNEIATWGNMIPENLEFHFDGKPTTARQARNVYGFQMARTTYESARQLMGGKRPFNLTRSAFSGIQRYAAVWTGDNVAYDEHMMLGIRLVNSLGLTGVAFTGYDVGGFVGDANTKLFTRWISIGSLSPFFRGHSMINSKDSEPWSFGEEAEQIARNYIRLRYQLLPYIYSLFYEASLKGMPVQRSLAIYYPHDHRVFQGTYQHQYFFGPNIMVAPVESNKEFMKVFFPHGTWYSLYDGASFQGDQEIIIECPIHRLPVFIRAGSVLPMQPPVQHTKEKVTELRLHVYGGGDPSSFLYYDDDGSTFEYQQDRSATRSIQFTPDQHKLIIEAQQGSYESSIQSLTLYLHHIDTRGVHVNGQWVASEPITDSLFRPLEKYDPINDPDSMGEEKVFICRTSWSKETLTIHW